MARLATVLTVWRKDEDAVKIRLGELERQRTGLEQQIAACAAARAEAAVPDLALREQYLAFCRRSRGDEDALRRDLAGVDQRIAATRDELAKAHRKVRSIEHLQSLDAAEAARRQDRRDQRQSDETAASRHQLKGS